MLHSSSLTTERMYTNPTLPPSILRLSQKTPQRLAEIAGDVTKLTETVSRVEGSIEKIDGDIQRIVRGMQKSLALLRSLQGPNYSYPHLVVVKKIKVEGKRSLWSRLRGMAVMDMTLHFLCLFNSSEVPCGAGGNGYRRRKTRGWVKKTSPTLQVRHLLGESGGMQPIVRTKHLFFRCGLVMVLVCLGSLLVTACATVARW